MSPKYPRSDWPNSLPTMYDLPSEDPEEPGLPDLFHDLQPQLLDLTFDSPLYPVEQRLIAKDLNLYYDSHHTNWYKHPDWFLVLGTGRFKQQQDLRLSYLIWQERISPFLVIELLSPGTEQEDLGQTLREVNQPPTKWQVYEQILRVPHYVVYDRYNNQFRAFHLKGSQYQSLSLPEEKLWFEPLGLGLGKWQGIYEGVEGLWLRWYDRQGNWIPTPTERAQEAENALALERQKREALLERLRAMGIDPEEL